MISVLSLLRAVQATDAETRTQAESQSSELSLSHPEAFFTALFEAAERAGTDGSDVSVSDGQAAVLIVKLVVTKHWSPGFEAYTGPPLSHETREFVRVRLLQLVATTSQRLICAATALVAARIGSLEYPDQWPSLVSTCVGMLNSPSTLTGGLLLLRELVADTMQEQDFFEHGGYMLEKLLEVARSPDMNNSCEYAVACFRQCITFLLMGDDDELQALYGIAEQRIPPWAQTLAELLRSSSDPCIQRECIDTLHEIDNAFASVLEPYVPLIVQAIVERLEKTWDPENPDDDPSLASSQLDIIDQFLRASSSASKLVFGTPGALYRYAHLLWYLSILSPELIDRWNDDVNDFVSFEEELASEAWPRQSAGVAVAGTGCPEIFSTVLELTKSAETWQEREAGIYLLGNLLQQLDLSQLDATLERQETLAQLVTTTSAQDDPVYCARCISLQGLLAKYSLLSRETRLTFVTAALDPSDNLTVVASQIRTIGIGCAFFPRELETRQRDALRLLGSLVPVAAEDTPAFLVEQFLRVLRLNFGAAIQEDDVFRMFFALAGKNTADVELNAQIIELVSDVMDHAETGIERVVTQLLGPVLQAAEAARHSGFAYSPDLNFALELAAAVLERDRVELPESDRESLLQVFYDVVTTTDDPQVLQAGSFAYAALVHDVGGNVNSTTAHSILQVAARLLDPELDDSAALASGKLVTAIVAQFGAWGEAEIVSQVLRAAAQRLVAAENALLIEGLVMVFCELVLRNASAVVDLLSQTTPDLLSKVMRTWVATFEVVRGADEIHQTVKAFQTLYDLHDPRLDTIEVDDKPIIQPGVRMTRSRAKTLQFTKVPLPIKILKLLIAELAQLPTTAEIGGTDDEWDDVEIIGTEGDVLDRRNFRLILDWFRQLGQEGMQWFQYLTASERNTLIEAAK